MKETIDIGTASAVLKENMGKRRSVRSFAATPVSQSAVENCIAISNTAPSGANLQPWAFVIVSNGSLKESIREAAEKVEREFYERRASKEWKDKLKPLGVTWEKPFLTEAPFLIAVFVQNHGYADDGSLIKHYFPRESTGIAVGFLISALHQIGLGTLTYTPAPIGFLGKLLDRPNNERGYMIIPVGYPSDAYRPPDTVRKTLDNVLIRR
jgi:iodotyrosine deiodinase